MLMVMCSGIANTAATTRRWRMLPTYLRKFVYTVEEPGQQYAVHHMLGTSDLIVHLFDSNGEMTFAVMSHVDRDTLYVYPFITVIQEDGSVVHEQVDVRKVVVLAI